MFQYKNGSTPVVVFLMVDETDGITAETGLSPTVNISKNGGSFAATTNSASEIANGWYKVALTATETNTDGPLIIRATATGAFPWRDVAQVTTNVLSDDDMDDIADHVLRRNFASARSGSGDTIQDFCMLNAGLGIVSKVAPDGSNMVIYQEDGSTPAVTRPISTDPDADPTTALGAPS